MNCDLCGEDKCDDGCEICEEPDEFGSHAHLCSPCIDYIVNPPQAGSVILGDGITFTEIIGQYWPGTIDLTVTSPPYDEIRRHQPIPSMRALERLGTALYHATTEGGVCIMIIRDSHKGGELTGTTRRLLNHWVDVVGWRQWADPIYARHGRPGAWWNGRMRVDHEYVLVLVKHTIGGTVKPRVFREKKVPAKHAGSTWHGTQTTSSGERTKIKPTEQKDEKGRGTIWFYNTSNTEGNKIKMQHKSTMPDALALEIIEMFSDPGDMVFDPLAGSGTTLRMADQSERLWLGAEIDPEAYEIINELLPSELKKKPRRKRLGI